MADERRIDENESATTIMWELDSLVGQLKVSMPICTFLSAIVLQTARGCRWAPSLD